MSNLPHRAAAAVAVLAPVALAACAPEPSSFTLTFAATQGGATVDCDTPLTGAGPAGDHTVGLSDLRFYVSNVQLLDEDGVAVEHTLDQNDFQYQGTSGQVSLVDLTGNTSGTCANSSIAYAEGTARTNAGITGTTIVEHVHSVRFDVGVPQALMQEVIANNSAEGAPSPLNEMYWSWVMGYRHFVFNMTVDDGTTAGEGYLHIGSTGCSAMGELALSDRDACDLLNTPAVDLHDFDLTSDVVAVDLGAALAGLDMVAPVYDPTTFEVIGETVGMECHSFASQDDCPTVFANFGLDLDTGAATAAANAVFGRR